MEAKKVFKPVNGCHLSEEQAQRYGERLDAIAEDHDGIITPEIILDDAKNKKSPLNDYFNWDDKSAANQFRLNQARELPRFINVIVHKDEEEMPVRYLWCIQMPKEEQKVSVYVPITEILQEEQKRNQLLKQAHRELQSWRKRYEKLNWLADVFQPVFIAIDSVGES